MVARAAAASKYREKGKKPKTHINGGPRGGPIPLCATVQIREFLGTAE
jgi:hypothetical protein